MEIKPMHSSAEEIVLYAVIIITKPDAGNRWKSTTTEEDHQSKFRQQHQSSKPETCQPLCVAHAAQVMQSNNKQCLQTTFCDDREKM
jgi:hypothetical protein